MTGVPEIGPRGRRRDQSLIRANEDLRGRASLRSIDRIQLVGGRRSHSSNLDLHVGVPLPQLGLEFLKAGLPRSRACTSFSASTNRKRASVAM